MPADTARRRDAGHNGGSPADTQPDVGQDRAQAAPLDMVLGEAAVGPAQRWNPGLAGLKAAGKLALQPRTVARRGAGLAAELAKIAAGRSEVGPAKSDRRFKDPAWSENPAFRRLGQTYLAVAETTDGLLCDVDLEWSEERRVRFAAENVIDAVAPTNFPLTNPAVLKAVADTGRRNFVAGLRHFASDMASRPRIPYIVNRTTAQMSEKLAVATGG